MELMRMSLDRLMALAAKADTYIPEEVMGRIAVSVSGCLPATLLRPSTLLPSTYPFISFFFQLLRALDYMKEEFRVMHRDIKPSNILLGFDGRIKVGWPSTPSRPCSVYLLPCPLATSFPQLCDFGIANIAENSLLHSHVGSELYLAPERVDPRTPNKTYDTRSDVWSLGLTLCELSHLRFPYNLPEARTVFALVSQVLNGEADDEAERRREEKRGVLPIG